MSKTVQNVNLYLPEFRRKKAWLSAERMLLLAGASIALLAVVSVVDYWQLARLRDDLAVREQEQRDAALATAALQEQFGVETEDLQLLDEIRQLEDGLQSKQALLQFLAGREVGNAEGFSEYLADLSRYHVQGLSLNEIRLTNGGRIVELGGQVVAADLVPVFVQSLGQGRAYAGMKVESVQIDEESTTVSALTNLVQGSEQAAAWNFSVRSQTR